MDVSPSSDNDVTTNCSIFEMHCDTLDSLNESSESTMNSGFDDSVDRYSRKIDEDAMNISVSEQESILSNSTLQLDSPITFHNTDTTDGNTCDYTSSANSSYEK